MKVSHVLWLIAARGVWPSMAAASEPAPVATAAHVAEEARSVSALGFARAIPRTRSASRDAPVFGLSMAPRGVRTAATELAMLTMPVGPVTLRPGFYGLIELEGDGDAEVTLWPSQEIHFWRGAFAFPVAVELDGLGPRLCDRCAAEASVQFRHESEHYTGANNGDASSDYSDRPIYGDAIGLDFGVSAASDEWFGLGRVALDVFLPDRSSYGFGPSLDLHVRYLALPTLHPFCSGFAQYRSGAELAPYSYPSAYLLRALAGVAFPSALGDLMLFLSGDVGHRQGLAAYSREATLGFGVRLALGPLPHVPVP